MKKIYLLVFLSFITTQLLAQTPQYAKGSGTGSNSYPFSSTAGLKTQHLYLPGDLPGAVAGHITRIYFRSVTSNTSASFTNFYFKLGQSTSTQFPGSGTTFFTGLTDVIAAPTYTVYSATGPTDWFYVDLPTPFPFDPTQSLVLEVVWDTKTAGGFNVRTSTGPSAPNNKRLTSATPTAATGSASTNWMDFGIDVNTTLSVKIRDFACRRDQQGVVVSWIESENAEIKDYEIERSNDGRSFLTVGTIAAKNPSTTQTNYSYTDLTANPEHTLFYRLKYNNLNGGSSYSQTLKLIPVPYPNKEMKLFPNPSTGDVTIACYSAEAGSGVVSITDMSGRTVYNSEHLLQAGGNFVVLNVGSTLSKGVYLVSLKYSEESRTARLSRD